MKKKKLLSFICALLFSVVIVVVVFKMCGNVNGVDDGNWIMDMIPLW